MGAKQSIKNPKDRERTSVKTKEPSKLRPERSKTDVNYNAETTNKRVPPPYIRPQLPYYLNEILKEADSPLEIDMLSTEQLYEQLYNGVHLKQNKKAFQNTYTNIHKEFFFREMGSGLSQDQDLKQNQELSNTSPQGHHSDAAVLNEEPRKIMPQSSKSTETKKTMEAARVLRFPHNYEEILKEADSSVDRSSLDKLYDQLYTGIYLNQKRKKYWVDKKSNGNCFMLYARDLLITWAENNRFWHWPFVQESSDVLLPAAELLDVCWLEIHGRFNTTKLSPGLIYEVVFIVMLKDPAYGWENPVNLRLILPDGSRQGHTENMVEKPREKWIEIPAGEFMTSADQKNGEIEFSLYEYEGGNWKKGLVIKGAVLRPKA
ncbi:hypothetical protein RDI58_004775 [Solanum bulbocastanum]|uniref:Uncharacterized protein n=1 Tax=Solanum bulbocastanum TaxID=147425 RepID=A0AAN8U2C6_SOLBU